MGNNDKDFANCDSGLLSSNLTLSSINRHIQRPVLVKSRLHYLNKKKEVKQENLKHAVHGDILDHVDYAYRAICERSDAFVFLMCEDGVLSYANPAACEFLAIPMNKLIGRSITEFVQMENGDSIQGRIHSRVMLRCNITNNKNHSAPIAIRFQIIGESDIGTIIACIGTNSLENKVIIDSESSDKPDFRKLSEAVRLEVEKERSIFARDIHDEICGNLSGILIQISNLKTKLAEKGDVKSIEELDKIARHTAETMDSSRRISHRIRPSLLDRLGIEAAIEQMLQEFSYNHGIETELVGRTNCLDDETSGKVLSDHQKIEIYRISHEIMNNVIKHANATRVRCEITCTEKFATFTFVDNGVGMRQESGSGNGIIGMGERALSAKGSLQISSAWPRGTAVKLRIEFSNAATGTEKFIS